MDDWDLSLPNGKARGRVSLRGLGPALFGWQVASLLAAISVSVGMAAVYRHEWNGAGLPAVCAWVFTAPTLLVRGMMRFRWGMMASTVVGSVIGVLFMPITQGFYVPITLRPGDFLVVETLMVYAASGAFAGASWWLTEYLCRCA